MLHGIQSKFWTIKIVYSGIKYVLWVKDKIKFIFFKVKMIIFIKFKMSFI